MADKQAHQQTDKPMNASPSGSWGASSSSTSSSPYIPVTSTNNHREVNAFLEGATNSAPDIDCSFSISGLSSDDDDDSVSGKSICKKIYLESGNSKQFLSAMAIGLTDEDDLFSNTNNEPYKSSKKRKHFVPSLKILQEEFVRHGKLFSPSKIPRPGNWPGSRCKEFLIKNPIYDSPLAAASCTR
jgi:hypothetical protein